jgi:hypothetical protein
MNFRVCVVSYPYFLAYYLCFNWTREIWVAIFHSDEGAILPQESLSFLSLSYHLGNLKSFILEAMSTSKLPPRNQGVAEAVHNNPVWTLSSHSQRASGANGELANPAVEPPLAAMCDQHARPDAVCCRTLKGEDERSLIDPDVVK